MNTKAIQNIDKKDFNGYWESHNNSAKLYVDDKATLTIGESTYQGELRVKYIDDSNECTNCLQISIGSGIFHVKQLLPNGFLLTMEGSNFIFSKKGD